MSTQPTRRSKTAGKRRAAVRRRTRTIGKHLFAYFAILLLVLGTISTVILGTAPTVLAPTVDALPTATTSQAFDALLTQADQAFTAGQWITATGLYRAYLSQRPENAQVQYNLGKSILSDPANADYVEALTHLQQAVNIAPNAAFATDARNLIAQYASKVTPPATGSVTGTLTAPGTGITSTAAVIRQSTGIFTATAMPSISGTITGTSSVPSSMPITRTGSPTP